MNTFNDGIQSAIRVMEAYADSLDRRGDDRDEWLAVCRCVSIVSALKFPSQVQPSPETPAEPLPVEATASSKAE